MPSTTTHGLPVPVSTDAPAGHTQMTTLAASIDAQLLTTVTSLPGSPVDGQRCLYLADATNGVVWDLRYRSASGSTFKWEFVGGGDLTATVATQESTSTGAFADLTTVGPSITVPLAGDYLVRFGARIGPQANSQSYMAPALGATAAAIAKRDPGGHAVRRHGIPALVLRGAAAVHARRERSGAPQVPVRGRRRQREL
jgi:hypothetical protein